MKLYAAWLIAILAVAASIYQGEILGMEPCRLCWYQRMAMFPLALFLGIATFKADSRLALYCLPLALFGAFFAIFQSVSQWVPSLQHTFLCGHHCSLPSVIPYLSAAAFLPIGILILLENRTNR